ncbi:MAG: hydroxymethylbilane synthase [Dehalococcoidia bacterium]|nr:hydroxymethylbilane synthase [Dehalococcoidia bacterium]
MAARALVIGTRGSKLALIQTGIVVSALRLLDPTREFHIKTIKTKGDVVTQAPLEELGRGAFSREIENALLAHDVDLAVHSLKDLPGQLPAGLVLAAVPERADARDVIVSKDGRSLGQLQAGAVIGTSSPRRTALVKELRPDVDTQNIRGNVDTRVRKLLASEYDAVVLAAAGLIRLGLERHITEFLDPDTLVPAISQGVLGVEARVDDVETLALLKLLDHEPTCIATQAERAFLRAAGAGCKTPIAAYATVQGSTVRVRGLVASTDGKRVYRQLVTASVEQAGAAGERLLQMLRAAGADDLLREGAA